ncbi:RNA-binding protein NOB1-like [Argiope bruennichi]|uniref:RNA-binding protein NOB1 n=1 Tax=Argiope bruennichi TaxID=94029 RepID=A0A8T0FRL1_ARGBR|nr:RNA-binding protein NOB1-like [Argiope bruennichi]KAF8793797.1 RNA-binding protein NOB1 like protein [Argiope bruennichi]
MEKRFKHLIVDSGAFIKRSPVHEYAEHIYTVRGVIREIKDKETLQALQFLPYELKLKEPSPESFKYVVEYSKKTGDYANLSLVDLQVLALTYQLVKENIGTDHLNKDPKCKVSDKPAFSDVQLSGFYIPKKDLKDLPENEANDSTELSELLQNNLNDIEKENSNSLIKEADNLKNDKSEIDINHSKSFNEEGNAGDVKSDEDAIAASSEENDADADDDEDSWLTPQNIDEAREKMGALKLDSSAEVACITTDFCVQNVLIQMGIDVVSIDGMLIKQARVHILRCFACYKTTNDITKKFCPNCGNKTLKRVAVTVNDDGTKNIHINFRRPLQIRGTRYSLPMPKGGKHAMNPILCEDQPIPHNRPCKKALEKIDVLDEDYVVRSSPFTLNDVNSRAAKLGIRANRTYQTRRNPNANKRGTGNRKSKR